MSASIPDRINTANARVREVFLAFLSLGLRSFGGPIAHLGYFRRAFVEQRRWLDDARFTELLALCQFLPGPASSQLGFAIGLSRAGWLGGLAAFAGFTLPSALLMLGFAWWAPYLHGVWGQALLHGLKLVAVVIVAQGVLGMWRTLAPDTPRRALAIGAALVLLWQPQAWTQGLVIVIAALLGPWLCSQVHAAVDAQAAPRRDTGVAPLLLAAYAILLLAALAIGTRGAWLVQTAAAFYRAGALVFGGGHVVLPWLREALVAPGFIDEDHFLAGYGAAQAVPGPMFSLAAYLGSQMHGGRGGVAGASVALLAIFLPGFLLLGGVLPYWRRLSARAGAVRMVAAINAAVVGILAAAFYRPVWTGAVHDAADVLVVASGFVMLVAGRQPAWVAVLWCLLASGLRHWLGN
ncbi:chromate ion family chromate transporter [Dyella solisilvae]|uniref:Chromate ion family chromate transporter n=1 Tax=Dyella solisilvae TaxID=1920168 RepID=A0A370K7V5_9GAMM|nr:chromate efflux transporter [Dyella solisilvae]RDI98713.1 chromate ion family chromate transporter [Dyella solisilvae]